MPHTETPRPARLPLPLTIALWWVAIWEPLAPASARTTWRDQWRAELWHYWSWLTRIEPRGAMAAALSLWLRASACVPHAASLRLQGWSATMVFHDVRFAWRMLLRRPAFTVVAILILGLGIGANATIFSWTETVLLEPLPGVGDANRLVAVRGTSKSRDDLGFSYLNFIDLQAARPDGFDGLIAFRPLAMSLRAAQEPMRVWGELVSANFFEVLRAPIALGRGFAPGEASTPGGQPVLVLSYQGWTRLFANDPGAIGRSVTLNGHPFTVIGVTAEGFRGSIAGVSLDVFAPLTMYQQIVGFERLSQRGSSFLGVYGRLADGAPLERAQSSASLVADWLARDYPKNNEGRGSLVVPLWKDGASGLLLPVMATLMAVVGVVLLIACANLAGLLLARAAGRQREVAVRLAIGASRGRLIRQFLIESALLAIGGGALGLVIASWTAGLLSAFMPPTPIPILFAARVSPGVLAFSVGVTMVTAIVCGLLPALRASRPDVAAALKDGAANLTAGGARGRLRHALVVSQVALSLLLLVCAALFVRGLSRAQATDPGYDLRDGLLASLDLPTGTYDDTRGIQLYRQMLQQVGALPEVESATLTSAMPLALGGGGSEMSVTIDGYQPPDGDELIAGHSRVAPGYFATMGIPIVRGRALDERDVKDYPLAVVINETMARRYWEGREAVGSHIRFGDGPAVVVGVARDAKYGTLNEGPRNFVYRSVYQSFRADMTLEVRTRGNPLAVLPAVQQVVRGLDPNLPLFDVRTVAEHRQLSVFLPRMASLLLGLFGALALLLAVVGLYSVVAYSVALRTREIGIRMALGAGRAAILGMVLRQGMRLTMVGLVIGVVLALVAARLLQSQLMGLSPVDPISFGATTLVLLGVALAACLVPAGRAASLDPLRALRRD